MMQSKSSVLAALLVFGGASLAIPSAQAQDQVESDEIVVTARKIEENVQSVPLAITALSGEALAQQSVQTLDDIQTSVPNLFLQQHPSEPQSLSFALRGQKQNDIPLTLDPSVGLYIDGLYYPRTIGLRGALLDLNRAEVLRGPQGTLYGRNTTGGAISLYSNAPTDEYGAEIGVMAGDYSAYDVHGIVNLPLAQGLALRAVAQYGAHDGYGEDGLGRSLGDDEGGYYRARLRWEPTESIRVDLFGSYHNNENGGPIITPASFVPGGAANSEAAVVLGVLPADALAVLRSYIGGVGGDRYHTGGAEPSFSTFDATTAGLQVEIDLTPDLTFRSISGWQRFDRANNGDYDGTPFTLVHALRTTEDDYYSQEVQLLGGDSTFNWVVGAYAGLEDGVDTTEARSLAALTAGRVNFFDAVVDNETMAVFAQSNWEFAPAWRLTTGYRYSVDERSVIARNHTSTNPCTVPAPGVPVTPPGASQCPRTFEDDFSGSSWLVSLDHTFSDSILGYLKVARGFRSGGINQRGAGTQESFAAFDPEFVTEYEAGFKSDLFDNVLRLNVAVYHDDYEDVQRSVGVPTVIGVPTTVVTNAAQATIDGVEVEARWRVTDQVTLNGGVGWTDASYEEFVDITGDRSGETFGLPEYTANIGGRYEMPTAWGELGFQLDYRWLDDTVLVPDALNQAAVTQEAYGLLSGRVSLAIDSIDAEVALFGHNLADEEYFAAAASSERSVGYSYLLTGEPRTIGVELVKRFGGL